MTDQVKEFMIKASEDKDLSSKLEQLKDEKDRERMFARAAEIAREAGFNVSAEDFRITEGEMNDKEMSEVAGGWQKCYCVEGGGGKADSDGKVCACVLSGWGERKDNNNLRCECFNFGYGDNSNEATTCQANGITI